MADGMSILSFEGDQTIEKAGEVKELFLKTLSSSPKKIVIKIGRIGKVDLSFLQLLYSLGLEAENEGIEISLGEMIPIDFQETVRVCGFARGVEGDGSSPFYLFRSRP